MFLPGRYFGAWCLERFRKLFLGKVDGIGLAEVPSAVGIYDGHAYPAEAEDGVLWLLTSQAPHLVAYCHTTDIGQVEPPTLGAKLYIPPGFSQSIPQVMAQIEAWRAQVYYDGDPEIVLSELSCAEGLRPAQIPEFLAVSRVVARLGKSGADGGFVLQFGVFSFLPWQDAAGQPVQLWWIDQKTDLFPAGMPSRARAFYSAYLLLHEDMYGEPPGSLSRG